MNRSDPSKILYYTKDIFIYISLFLFFCSLWPFEFFVYTVFTLEVSYPEHSQLAFDCVVIACSLEPIRSALVQGCKAPNGVG